MRFISGGPIIPDHLLSERDAGRVVFLCGAGVSIPSGLPSFEKLTGYVIDRLSPDKNSDIARMFAPWRDEKLRIPYFARTPLDQIFNILQQVYRRDHVGRLVAECLTITGKSDVDSHKHEIIGRLSTGQDGTPQIVTTNFDHLFERALSDRQQRIYTPPTFPDLRHGVSVSGITYLHGRLSEPEDMTHDYVLGSADFGRAYLSEGWATSFIRQLLRSYTVVLLGYQAEDPPVKYLLQGLNGSQERGRERLYAFDMGAPEEVGAKWLDRGVTSIAYPESQNHSSLWDTLDAWTIRADNPVAWSSSIIDLARHNPQDLSPHKRGMVAHQVQTALGAKQFADANPPLPIEWLFVFDKNRRLAEPSKSFGAFDKRAESFDPLNAFGLDDDPVREEVKAQFSEVRDLIIWKKGDESMDQFQRLAVGYSPKNSPLPSRLFHFCRWLSRHINHPALAWWVAHQPHLHPKLLEIFTRAVDDADDLPSNARKFWMILLENHETGRDPHQFEWYQVRERISKRGWSGDVIRALASATEPYLKVDVPYGLSKAQPPKNSWSDTTLRDIANIDVKFPRLNDRVSEVSDSALVSVFSVLQQNLVRAAHLLNETEQYIFEVATLYPEQETNDQQLDDQEYYLTWFLGLFNQMVDCEPQLLRAYVATWPNPERYIFDKLRLYAWNKEKLFSGSTVQENLSALSAEQFWNSGNVRELMFLLRSRWSDFSDEQRAAIAHRIMEGRPAYEGEEQDSHYLEHRNIRAVMYFGWLVREGCEMPLPLKQQWDDLKEGLNEWSDSWIDGLVSTNSSRAGWVKTEEDPSALEKVPVAEVITIAKENSGRIVGEFIDCKPFRGLVKSRPVKALAALCWEARKGQYPVGFWNELISNWPAFTSSVARLALVKRLCLLPTETVFEIRWTISQWLENQFPQAVQEAKTLSYHAFDCLVEKLLSSGPEATRSGIGESRTGEQVMDKSRRTKNHAINGPIGRAVQGLIKVLSKNELDKGCGLPEEFITRIEKLLMAQGEGQDHVVCILSLQAPWLNYIDPDWVTQTIIPWFNPENPHSEPAWNGLLTNHWVDTVAFFSQIKSHFLALPKVMNKWSWCIGRENPYSTWLVQAVVFPKKEEPRLTFSEARNSLRQMTQNGRLQAIWFLGRVGKKNTNGWEVMVVPFIQNAWPVEQQFQTEQTSKAWINILDDTGDKFPLVFKAVRNFLYPIQQEHINLYGLDQESETTDSLVVRFPHEILDLLDLIVLDNLKQMPYPLAQILNTLGKERGDIISDRRYQRLREIEAAV